MRELERIVAEYQERRSPEVRGAAFMASVEIATRERWRGSGRGARPTEDLLRHGPLPPKGMIEHNEALKRWQSAKSIIVLIEAAEQLARAAEFRRDMGDIGGLCASLNVLSLMAQRWAWLSLQGTFPGARNPGARGALQFARARSLESYRIARRHDIPFHISQALVSLSICYLRQGKLRRASNAINELCGMPELDARTEIEARFCVAMLTLATGSDVRWCALQARDRFADLAADHTPDSKHRLARIAEAAKLDAALCTAWSEEKPLGQAISLSHRRPRLAADSTRLSELAGAVPTTPADAVQLVLDPLGP